VTERPGTVDADLAEIERTAASVGVLDRAAMASARRRLDDLTKPPGSLGRLEAVVVHLAGITGRVCPEVLPGTVVVAAADHGVVTEGVSAYPAEVTAQMVGNFLAGGAAINALAANAGLAVRVIDAGVRVDVEDPRLERRKVRRGTGNMVREPAMQRHEALATVAAGIAVAREEAAAGCRLIVPGDMGIGNTTAASALLVALGGVPPSEAVGRGTGVDDAGLERKRRAVETAVALHRPDPLDPWDALAKVGGLEIALLAGLILGAAAHRIPVLLDGFISGAAALVACRAEPRVTHYLLAAHRSAEAGHRALLRALGLDPLLDLGMRLGEGSGAAAAAPLLAAACRFMRDMATFEEASVARRAEEPAAARPGTLAPPAQPGVETRNGPQDRPRSAVGAPRSDSAASLPPPAWSPSPGPRSLSPLPGNGSATTASDGFREAPAPREAAPPPGGPESDPRGPARHAFPPEERAAVYRAIYRRRDMRSFRPDPVPDHVLGRLLWAAHHAPSVGFMQPWRFVVIRDPRTKADLKALVERERQAQALHFSGRRAELFPRLKVDGIAEAPVVVCVAVDPTSGGDHVLGRNADPATDVYSAACAIENLWLAARAEGLGVGWVTFFKKADVRRVLGIPPHVDPVALLCIGYVDAFPDRPVLEEVGWARRLPIEAVVAEERWGGPVPSWVTRQGPPGD
jgi:nicotinate-nucleotide--dimethylbenzimidazole phosphoribosyltransferase